MIMTLFLMSTILSISFLFLNHPLSMGLMLMTQTIIISLITGTMISKFWFSYILFMIMIGGMMILFLYMTSIASNKKFNFSWKILMLTLLTSFTLMSYLLINEPLMNSSTNHNINLEMSLMKYFNFPTSLIMMTLILYLLITLIAIVKITSNNYGPLRQL